MTEQEIPQAQATPSIFALTINQNEVILGVMQAFLPEREVTLAEVEQTLDDNEKKRLALFEKYQRMYPDAEITDNFLFEIRKIDSDVETCRKCTGYPCKISNKGQKPVIKEVEGVLKISSCICKHSVTARQQAIANSRFKNAKIPQMYVGKTFADYEVDGDNKNSVAWAKKLEGLYLFGRPGTGKTFLAAIMAQELLKQGKSVIFGDVPTLLDQLKGTFDSDSDSTLEQLMQTLSEVDVLILDDLGSETPTEWAVERLYLIVNNRYAAGKKLIVTSNYDPDAAEKRLNNPKAKGRSSEGVTGSRIMSRIKQMCKLTILNGSDRRRR